MTLGVLLLFYVLALIYGSLMPFGSAHRTIAEALQFLDEPLPAATAALANADFGMNVILYAPLGALAVLTLLPRSRRPDRAPWSAGKRLLVAIVAVLCATALSLAIEFAQSFLVLRKASLQDVVANSLGAFLGASVAAAFAPGIVRSLATLRTGGASALRPFATFGLGAFVLFSFYPFDFIGGISAWDAKVMAGRNGAIVAGAVCSGISGCLPGLMLETAVAAMIAILVNLRFPLGPNPVRWLAAGALIGMCVELVQSVLDSGIAQGVSVATRAFGFFVAGLLVNRLQPGHVDFARRHAGLLAMVMTTIAAVVILQVNRIRIPFAVTSEPLAIRLGAVEWLPFRYALDVGESWAALSIVAQMAGYAIVGAALWLGSLGRFHLVPAVGAAVAAALALAIEGTKLFMDGRHPDPTDVLLAALACGVTISLLQRFFAGPAQESSGTVTDGNAESPGGSRSVDAMPTESPPAGRVKAPAVHGSANEVGRWARIAAIALFFVAATLAYGLPRFESGVLLIVGISAGLVAWRRDLWLLTIPLALPVFDLTRWTGRMFWTEFDSLCAATLAVLWWRNGFTAGISWLRIPGGLTLAGLALWMVAGAFIAGWPLPLPERANLDSYFSPYVGFHALKGVGWALLFYPFAARAFATDREHGSRRFAIGMCAGFALTTLFVLWERFTFSGLFNLAHDYRVTGPFSAMHVGGAYIEGYLVGALPFAAFFVIRYGLGLLGAAAAALLAGGSFALLVTHSREAYLALIIATLAFVLLLIFARSGSRHARTRQLLAALVATAILGGGLLTLGMGRAIQQRFATIQVDIDIRLDHWARSLRILGEHPMRWVTGIGAGHYADRYFWQPDATEVPGRITFLTDGADSFVRMGAGASIHLSQAVDAISGQHYVFTARVRANDPQALLTIPLCEKWLLDSFNCVRNTFAISGPAGQWVNVHWDLDTQPLRYALRWVGRPVQLSLLNPNALAYVDVTSVSLRDAHGVELVRNGDFSAGTDNWLATTDSHLAWHAKNLPLHVLVELGLVGLALFVLLVVRAIIAATRAALLGDLFAVAVLAALAGMLTVGLTDSLIDAPRIAMQFFLLLEVGLLVGRPAPPSA